MAGDEASGQRPRVTEIFHAALERDGHVRAAFLEGACDGDLQLRAEVERLLATHSEADAFLEHSPATASGRRIGRYEIGRLLGVGGMGAVYLARDVELGRDVALKIGASSDSAGRLHREAQRAAQLNHPHICTIHEVGDLDGQCFIVMEHVEGRALSALIPPGGLPIEDVVRYGAQIADALAYAHARGIVHCDVKSANVVVTPDGRAKVLDFGIARRLPADRWKALTQSHATSEGEVAGTLPCMAPEVLRGENPDARSDIWGLGVLLYEMATGGRPFTGRTGYEVSAAIFHEAPPPLPPRVPAPLQQIVRRCLEKDPVRRFQSAAEIRSQLEKDTVETSTGRHARPMGWRVALAMLLILVASGAGALAWRLWRAAGGAVPSGSSGRPTIAVMAFDNLAGDAADSWLSKGVQSMLLTGLAQTRGLAVVSMERLQQAVRDVGHRDLGSLDRVQAADVARRAGAGATVVGSIAQANGVIRIDAQVEDLANGRILTATSVNGTDVFAVVDQLAVRIRETMGIRGDPPYRPTAEVSTVSLQAFRLYAQGRDAAANLRLADARTLLLEAVTIDPGFADAYLELALLSGPAGRPVERSEYLRKAEEHAERLSEPRRLLMVAERARDQGQYRDAGRALDDLRALFPDLDAISTMAQQLYPPVVGPLADGDKLLAVTADAVAANPASPLVRNKRAYALLYVGRFDEAFGELHEAVRLAPREPNPFDSLGEAHLLAGMPEKAIDAYSRAMAIDPTFVRGGRAWALGILGRFDEALRDEGSPPYLTAVLLARAGRYREAGAAIRSALRAAEEGGDPTRMGALRLVSALMAVERHDHLAALAECVSAEQLLAQAAEDRRRFTRALGALICGVADLQGGRLDAARARLTEQRRLYATVGSADRWWEAALEAEMALATGDADGAARAASRAVPPRRQFFSRLAEGSVLSNDLVFRDAAARAALARGDLRDALDLYRRLLSYGPESRWVAVFEPRYLLAIARVHERLGDTTAARTEYERFLRLWSRADRDLPETAETRQALARLRVDR